MTIGELFPTPQKTRDLVSREIKFEKLCTLECGREVEDAGLKTDGLINLQH